MINFSFVKHYAQNHVKFTVESILGSDNKHKCIERISKLKPIGVPSHSNLRDAAVLVPLCLHNSEVSLLLTIRSRALKNNGGQVAFPGGMYDEKDRSLQMTALRETSEEVGLSPDKVEMWCAGPKMGRTDMLVTPFLGYVGELEINKLRLNPDEVETAFAVPLRIFCLPESFHTTRFRLDRAKMNLTLPVYNVLNYRIWGLTAMITHIMMMSLIPNHYLHRLPWEPSRHLTNLPKVAFA